jgi:hypothetical protein
MLIGINAGKLLSEMSNTAFEQEKRHSWPHPIVTGALRAQPNLMLLALSRV